MNKSKIKSYKVYKKSETKKYLKILDEINKVSFEGFSADDLKSKKDEVMNRDFDINNIESLMLDVYRIIKEVSKRKLGLLPYDVQLLGGIALYYGKLIEMQTGEGKTLVAIFPAILRAISKEKVHILTFNDYLAKRDAEWMGPVYEYFGLSVGYISDKMPMEERRKNYNKDITYLTAKEAGFDYLRDMTALDISERIQGRLDYVIVDEADSILIDEAKIPLILAGEKEGEIENVQMFSKIADTMVEGKDYNVDADDKNVYLTEDGTEKIEEYIKCGNLYDEKNMEYLAGINCALYARGLLKKDVDYIIKDGRIKIVDELTGRVAQKRHWPDGIQAAVEAKEGLNIEKRGRLLATTTIQHYIKKYKTLCGMTATAVSSSNEFLTFYGLLVIVISPNKECIRIDEPDFIFARKEVKYKALVQEIIKMNKIKRPVLIGTTSIEESEYVLELLTLAGLKNINILNAKNDELEAEIIKKAGSLSAITVSTNMAGRGTDIKLGGAKQENYDEVAKLGGLYVIGLNKHESERIDNQLRGRAGRQGDPGSSRFFISLEDDLIVKYGIRRVVPERILHTEKETPFDNKFLNNMVNHVQKFIDGQSQEMRKTLWNYSYILENQREIFDEIRNSVLNGQYKPFIELKDSSNISSEKMVELKKVLLIIMDSLWSDYLESIETIKEAIHLVSMSGKNPLDEYHRESINMFDELLVKVDNKLRKAIEKRKSNTIDDKLVYDNSKPSTTWTYMVSDNLFINNIKVGDKSSSLAYNNPYSLSAIMFFMPHTIFFNLFFIIRDWLNRKNKAR